MIHLAFSLALLAAISPSTLKAPAVSAPTACVGLSPPLQATQTAPFAPMGQYAGHWGVDYEVDEGTPVSAAGAGWVSHAGIVAGNRTVTVDHGGGLKTSYSFLGASNVFRGAKVQRGAVLGTSGTLHGGPDAGLHFSVRIDGLYVDPLTVLGCPSFELPDALRLVPVHR